MNGPDRLDYLTLLPSWLQLWTAETPHLYIAVVVFHSESGSLIQAESAQLGFRETKLKDGVLLHNNRRIMLKGVNRHEFDPDKGEQINVIRQMSNHLSSVYHYIGFDESLVICLQERH